MENENLNLEEATNSDLGDVSGSFFDIIEGNVKMQMEVENFVRQRIYRFLLNEYDLKLTFKEWVSLNYR